MIYEEKLSLINYMFRIKKFTAWNVYLFCYLKEFIKDKELIKERARLLDLVYKIVTNKIILQYVGCISQSYTELQYEELIREMINLYLMNIEDMRTNLNKTYGLELIMKHDKSTSID